MLRFLTFWFLLFSWYPLLCQQQLYSENNKWGIKEGEKILIAPVYDTVFHFDKNNKVCMACFKSKSINTNKFIKVTSTLYSCNYLNSASQRLIIKTSTKDTCSVFQLGKNSVQQYTEDDSVFKVKVKNRMYLVHKSFKQLTFKNYTEINLCDEPGFYVAQGLNEVDVPMYGLITTREEMIIPFQYSGIKVNPSDSLIMVCGTGYGAGTEDYVFDYKGKRLQTYKHHVDLATKEFIVFKVFEPREQFLCYHIETKEEKPLEAEEIRFYKENSVRMRTGSTWWIYNLKTGEKTELKNDVK